MVTNPEDTGIFNPRIRDYTEAVHAVGGVCAIDQANANGILGITRARELGFDLCHFNLHKTFSTPHNSEGPGLGAVGVREDFARYLPVPIVSRTGKGGYRLDYDRPDSIGKVKVSWATWASRSAPTRGSWPTAPRDSAPSPRPQCSTTTTWPGSSTRYRVSPSPTGTRPHTAAGGALQLGKAPRETGVSTNDIKNRMIDYGVNSYFTSHEPWLIAEPFTAEPAESYSKQDLDEYAAIVAKVAEEAYTDPSGSDRDPTAARSAGWTRRR